MTTLSFYTFGGRTRARNTNTGRVETYLPNDLGSVISAPTDSATSGRVSRHTPYGQEYYSNNVWQKPRTGWVGELQYRSTPLRRSDHYMRARHYSDLDHRWTTRDPLWPRLQAFGYVAGAPLAITDRLGQDYCDTQYSGCKTEAGVLLGACVAGLLSLEKRICGPVCVSGIGEEACVICVLGFAAAYLACFAAGEEGFANCLSQWCSCKTNITCKLPPGCPTSSPPVVGGPPVPIMY